MFVNDSPRGYLLCDYTYLGYDYDLGYVYVLTRVWLWLGLCLWPIYGMVMTFVMFMTLLGYVYDLGT